MGIEYSAHLPSPFITTHMPQLLPSWGVPVASVLIIFQRCPVCLADRTATTERHKNKLRDQFIQFGHQIASSLTERGYLAEIFDPPTGQPILSAPGTMVLDDVAVVQALLGYPLIETGGCWVLKHPRWGTAVFPAVFMSSACPEVLLNAAGPILSGQPLANPA